VSKSLLIKGGRLVDPSQSLDTVGDLFIENGKVKAVGRIEMPVDKSVPVLDATALVITPGWIDMHTHLREPGASNKETIQTGTQAAAAGGMTSIACMANTNPVNDSAFITSYIHQKAAADSVINVYPIGAITKGLRGEELAEIGSMYEAGIAALSDDGKTVMNSYLMRKALDYSKKFDLAVISHAEDVNLKGKGVMNEGFNSARFGLRGIPRTSEDLIVARDILLAELTGARIHVAHLSTIGSVDLVRWAKKRGVRVTAEVTPHHLNLTDDAVANYDTNTKVAPPLREQRDVDAVREALADGTIDIVASDHAPHAIEDKLVEYDLAEFGMVGLETAFPLYYRMCLKNGVALSRLIASLTTEPAKVLGIPKGTLKVGADADVSIFDPEKTYRIDKLGFRSKSRNTPFDGWEVQGKVRYTIVAGRVVYNSEDSKENR
jgi:dihydroorotase